MLKPGSPVFEIARAIQAFARALSAIRSAREGVLSLNPPAVMYCCAILPRERQCWEFSYFKPLSRTSPTHRLAAVLSWWAIDSSCEGLRGEHADIHGTSKNSGAMRSQRLIRFSSPAVRFAFAAFNSNDGERSIFRQWRPAGYGKTATCRSLASHRHASYQELSSVIVRRNTRDAAATAGSLTFFLVMLAASPGELAHFPAEWSWRRWCA
jgi:hypothetical protein